MTDLKRITPQKILWLDLEMTGLNPMRDRMVEVAAIVTDWNFNELGTFESGIRQNLDELKQLYAANAFASAMPEYVQKLTQLSQASPNETEVEQQLLAFIKQHFSDGPALLGGNSIHVDRQFIRRWWPKVDAYLHYRMLDVSAWKVVMIGKYGIEFPKKETHRALDDVRESIAELKAYLNKAQS